ncbi:Zinc finger MYND domain-containing protein [Lachnellula suecica]|uniref:Zinc finger MYND domain-containing protein n=1 Tax=Lachnellula suecica TaxID=602035 RepID=A0A8T9C1I1_9HELO|nr:Zinc finger MYND domain-containing protein [Lachnellula suecica]
MAQREVTRVSLGDMQRSMAQGDESELLNAPKCAVCNIIEAEDRKLLACARCKKTKYCGKDCQSEDWEAHKKDCKAQNYILKVDLEPEEITNPRVSRTLSSPANATFDQLHRALQTAFGWASTHTYNFKIKDPNVEPQPLPDLMSFITQRVAQDTAQNNGMPMPDAGPKQNLLRIIEKDPYGPGGFGGGRGIDAMHNRNRVHSQTPEKDSTKIKLGKYDFGDCWAHKIEVVGRADASKRFECLGGEGHGVAEDAGSIKGWLDLREAYRTDTPNREQKEKRAWFEKQASNSDSKGLGNGRDEMWDQDAINAKLRR